MPNPWDPIAGDYKARDGWIVSTPTRLIIAPRPCVS
jgi:hypothetical protein